MSQSSVSPGSFWDWPETRYLSKFVLLMAVIGLVARQELLGGVMLWRVEQLLSFQGLAPGTDLTLLLARILLSFGIGPATALLLAGFFALIPLAYFLYQSMAQQDQKLDRSLLIAAHPLAYALILSGQGWTAPALYFLWRTLGGLPRQRPQQGMVQAGIAIGFAYLAIPGFGPLLLPLAACLFLCAPKAAMARHPLAFHVVALAPALMIFGAFAYLAALHDIPRTGPTPDRHPLLGVLATAAIPLSAPWLFDLRRTAATGPRLAALLMAGFAAAWGVGILAVASLAAFAQAGLATQRQVPKWWSLLSFAGGLLLVIGLGLL